MSSRIKEGTLTGSDVKLFRSETSHTQASLAAALGVPVRTVVNWENGGNPPAFLGLALAALSGGLKPWAPWADVEWVR